MPPGIYQHYNKSNATQAQLDYWERLKETPPSHCFKKGFKGWIGEDNAEWKGDKVKYRGLHHWVEQWKGKPINCETCGKLKTTPRSIQWANIDHKYRRDLEDWLSLCIRCHWEYDIANHLRGKNKL